MKKIVILIIVFAVSIYQAIQNQQISVPDNFVQALNSEKNSNSENNDLKTLFNNRQSDTQIQGSGVVIKILADDLEGSRHQKFILKNGNGQTLLISHNIDLAPRIDDLRTGDLIEYYGEYEWNHKGGLVHWTHKDPKQYHVDGWLKKDGKTYQ